MARQSISASRAAATARTAANRKAQYSLDLNGTSAYIALWQNPVLLNVFNKKFSVEMWIKGASGQNGKGIFVMNRTAGNGLYQLTTNVAGQLASFVRNDGGGILVNGLASTTTLFDNTWHHMLYSDDAGVVGLYIDGVADATNLSYTLGANLFDSINRVAIGASLGASASAFFAGRVRRVRVYNKGLSAAEALAAYNNAVVALRANIAHELSFVAGAGQVIGNSGFSPISWQGVNVAYSTDVPANSGILTSARSAA